MLKRADLVVDGNYYNVLWSLLDYYFGVLIVFLWFNYRSLADSLTIMPL